MVDSDIGNHAFSVGFCRQIFVLKLWHCHGILLEKTMSGKENTTCTYPSQCSEASCSLFNSQITAGWSGTWPASHYFIHLVTLLICFSISSGKVVIIFDLFVFLF